MVPPALDVHAHFVDRRLLKVSDEFRVVSDGSETDRLFYGDRHLGPFVRKLVEIDEHVTAMDEAGIGHRLLCTASWLNFYWLTASEAERLVRAHNELLAEVAASNPRRFSVLASVPLQDPKMAIRMIESAVHTLDAAGIAVGSNVNGAYFDHPQFDEFLAAAADLEVPLFLHPDNVIGGERLNDYALQWLAGNAVEATVALSRVLLGGVFDRHPHLKVGAPLGGGGMVQLLGRLDHGWEKRSDARTGSARPPSHYLDRCWFDTVVHSTPALQVLIDHVGADRLVVGSDYPWAMGVSDPLGALSAVGLPDAELSKVAFDNALGLIAPRRVADARSGVAAQAAMARTDHRGTEE